MTAIVRVDVQGKGGVAHSIFFESKAVAENGFDVSLVTTQDNEMAEFKTPAEVVKRNLAFYGFKGFWDDTLWLIKFCKKCRANIIHFQWPPNINNCYILFHTLRKLGFKVIYTVDNVLPHERFYGDSVFYGRLYLSCDYIIVHSNRSKQELLERFCISEKKISVIPFGCYSEFCKPDYLNRKGRFRDMNGISKNTKIITMLGEVRYYKGTEDGIKAFLMSKKAGDDTILLIAGRCNDNILKNRIENLIEKNSSNAKIIFINKFLKIDEMKDITIDTDIFLLPYKFFSSQCGILSFVYPFGKPVIVRESGSMGEFVLDCKNGFVVKVQSIEALSEKLKILLDDDELRNKFGEKSKEFAIEKFNFQRTASMLCEVYRRFSK